MSKGDPDASRTGEVITVAYDVDDAELRTKVKEIIAKASGEISLCLLYTSYPRLRYCQPGV